MRCRAGDAGEDGGDDSCGGARAKRAFFTVAGGVVTRCALGDRSPLKEE